MSSRAKRIRGIVLEAGLSSVQINQGKNKTTQSKLIWNSWRICNVYTNILQHKSTCIWISGILWDYPPIPISKQTKWESIIRYPLPWCPHSIGNSTLPSCPGLSVYWVRTGQSVRWVLPPVARFQPGSAKLCRVFPWLGLHEEEQFHHLLCSRADLHTTTLVSDFSQLCPLINSLTKYLNTLLCLYVNLPWVRAVGHVLRMCSSVALPLHKEHFICYCFTPYFQVIRAWETIYSGSCCKAKNAFWEAVHGRAPCSITFFFL